MLYLGGDGYLVNLQIDGVVGQPYTIGVSASGGEQCHSVRVTGPYGSAVPSTRVGPASVTFVPMEPGIYIVYIDDHPFSEQILEAATPALLLPRRCRWVVHAASLIGCDEALFAVDGGLVAALDGGLWMNLDDRLLAWNGSLATARFSDGGLAFGPPVPIGRPESASGSGELFAMSTGDGGVLFEVDGGQLTPIASLPVGLVDVLDDGQVVLIGGGSICTATGNCQTGLSFPVSAGRGGLVFENSFPPGFPPSVSCMRPLTDGGWTGSNDGRCGEFVNEFFNRGAPGSPFPRRPLAQMFPGTHLKSGGGMVLADGGVASSGDDFAWQSSENQTAIWFQ